MKTKTFWTGLALLLLSACGPIIGGMMVASNGIKDFKVIQGDFTSLPAGSRVAVLGPFDKTAEAFYICRGEDAAGYASEFNQSGLFSAELAMATRFPEERPKAGEFKGRAPADIQKALGLNKAPTLIMNGTILKREMVSAPVHGDIMTATYRLEFLNLADNEVTVIEVTTKELFQDVIPRTVEYLAIQQAKK